MSSEVDAKDEYDQMPLHKAAIRNDNDWIEGLAFLADFNEKDKKGLTPLHCAAMENSYNSHFSTIKTLLKNGANVDSRDEFGKMPLHYLVRFAGVKTVKLLLDNEASLGEEDCEGDTPLFVAATYHNAEIVQLLVDHGSNVNHISQKGFERTPLHAAVSSCFCENLETVKCLLKNGANIDACDSGDSVIMDFFNSQVEIPVEMSTFFLKYADVNVMNCENESIMNYHLDRNILELIMQHVAKLQALNIDVQWIMATISYDDLDHYFKDCTNELLSAKSKKFKNSWVTYFDLLVANKKKLKNFAGNTDLINDFKNSHCLKKFPIYGRQMLKNLKKGIYRRRLFEKTSISICNYLPIFNPNHLIVRDILDCVSTKDLSKLYK